MPLIHEERQHSDTTVQVWRIEEDLSFFTERLPLTPEEVDGLHRMHPRLALEWAASRYMLHEQTDLTVPFACLYDAHGRPYIPGAKHNISISHSHGLAAVVLSEREAGIDIQLKSTKVERIRHKFVSPEENVAIAAGDSLLLLHLCWSAKEALYKAYARRRLEFREHIFVNLPQRVAQAGTLDGTIKKDGFQMRCLLFYRFIEQHVLVYAIEDQVLE